MGEAKRRGSRAKTIYERQSPEHRLGDAPIEEAFHRQMTAIAEVLDETFNGDTHGPARKIGFVLLVFPFGDEDKGRCNFISNGADRRDIVTLFKEMIARFEGQPEVGGRA